jgi:hypothetical protein
MHEQKSTYAYILLDRGSSSFGTLDLEPAVRGGRMPLTKVTVALLNLHLGSLMRVRLVVPFFYQQQLYICTYSRPRRPGSIVHSCINHNGYIELLLQLVVGARHSTWARLVVVGVVGWTQPTHPIWRLAIASHAAAEQRAAAHACQLSAITCTYMYAINVRALPQDSIHMMMPVFFFFLKKTEREGRSKVSCRNDRTWVFCTYTTPGRPAGRTPALPLMHMLWTIVDCPGWGSYHHARLSLHCTRFFNR